MSQQQSDLAQEFYKIAEILLAQIDQNSAIKSCPELHDCLIRRAISTAYYSVFHLVAKSCADAFIPDKDPEKPWVEIYRGLEHSGCKKACQSAEKEKIDFPAGLMDIATAFSDLQELREEADYNPIKSFTKEEAESCIERAKKAYEKMKDIPIKHRRAFASWVMIDTKGARKSRKKPHKEAKKNTLTDKKDTL